MTKIKSIHCFGTSFTAGGGFEFESISGDRYETLSSFYMYSNENLTQYNFSYPGQLQKLLGENFKVYNHGKNGYGNEMVYRKIYDTISDSKFNSDENVFLIEFSGLGRKEFWSNVINDYIIVNYKINWETETYDSIMGIANSYWYDSDETHNLLLNEYDFFDQFFKKTFDLNSVINQMDMNMKYLISYLKYNNIKFYIMTEPLSNEDNDFIKFGDGKYFKITNSFTDFSYKNKLRITDETDGGIIDDHNGLIANKIISEIVYNKLIDDFLISSEKIKIDWVGYKNSKKFTNTKIL